MGVPDKEDYHFVFALFQDQFLDRGHQGEFHFHLPIVLSGGREEDEPLGFTRFRNSCSTALLEIVSGEAAAPRDLTPYHQFVVTFSSASSAPVESSI